jgi:hypothetical protein
MQHTNNWVQHGGFTVNLEFLLSGGFRFELSGPEIYQLDGRNLS